MGKTGFEELLHRILSSRKDLTREDLLEMINEKKEGAQKFFTNEAAARIVAMELGVKIGDKSLQPNVQISDLVSGLSDVTITGQVIEIYPPKSFIRQDQTEGKFASLILKDTTGTLRVVLWNDKTNLVGDERVKIGHIVKVLHGYMRKGRDGGLELHVGSRGRLQILPPDAIEGAGATMLTKIEDLKPNLQHVDTLARVVQIGDIRQFKRSTTKVGHVSTLLIKDETGYAQLNLWEDAASTSKEIHPRDAILIQGAYTRKRYRSLTLNIGNRGTVILNPEMLGVDKLPPFEEEVTKTVEIKKEGGPITVEGIVASPPTVSEVATSKGEKVSVVIFDLKDNTGMIRVSAWRKLAEIAKNLTTGTTIQIENAYARKGFEDRLELTSRMFTSIKRIPKTGEILS
jgi:replication factor A1